MNALLKIVKNGRCHVVSVVGIVRITGGQRRGGLNMDDENRDRWLTDGDCSKCRKKIIVVQSVLLVRGQLMLS